MYSSVVLGLLTILTLTTTTAACTPGTPNGTTNRGPGGPESVVWGVAGPTYAGTGWVETASLSYWLILLLIPVIAKLTTRVQQLEDALNRKPTPDAPTPMTTTAVEPPPTTGPTTTELMARIEQLEEARVPATTPDDEPKPTMDLIPAAIVAQIQQLKENQQKGPQILCPLTGPTTPFFRAMWRRPGRGASPIEYLDPTNYFGYEMQAIQEQDSICRWFIEYVVKPQLAGTNDRADPVHMNAYPEVMSMMNK